MDLRNIIKAKKSGIDTGKWGNGHMSRPNWPSRKAKAKAYKWGPDYHWRVLQCDVDWVLGKCRVRLILNKRKQIFRATLGVTVDGETKTLCDYEYHASEPGWHCHARCDHLDSIDPATNRFGGARIPKA